MSTLLPPVLPRIKEQRGHRKEMTKGDCAAAALLCRESSRTQFQIHIPAANAAIVLRIIESAVVYRLAVSRNTYSKDINVS